jgi:hypothetical protein
MAPLITHLVVGERTCSHLQHLGCDPAIYGAFLLGCVLVDANGFSDLDRRQTHFVGGLEDDGEVSFRMSCSNFLSQRDQVVQRPWAELTLAEQAFIAGYLCHLAADEVWKEMGWRILQAMGLKSLKEMPVPGEVLLTVYDVLSRQVCAGWPAVECALNSAAIPEVMTHVPYPVFQRVWEMIKPHILAGGAAEAYFALLDRMGTPVAQVQEIRRQHEVFWDEAVELIHNVGGIEQYLAAAVERSASVLPQLWIDSMRPEERG